MLSSLARYSQEPKLKKTFEILQFFFEKISVFYSDWPKSWIWRTLGHVRDIFCKYHLHNTSKGVFQTKLFLNFMQSFKSTIFPELKNCQNGTFKPRHGIQIFLAEGLFWSVMKMTIKNIFLTYLRVHKIQDLGQSE